MATSIQQTRAEAAVGKVTSDNVDTALNVPVTLVPPCEVGVATTAAKTNITAMSVELGQKTEQTH